MEETISFDTLMGYVEGTLSTEAQDELRKNPLFDTPRYQDQLRAITRLLSVMRSTPAWTPAPDKAVNRARDLFRERYPQKPAEEESLTRRVVRLLFDSCLPTPDNTFVPAFVRGDTQSRDVVQLLYDAGDCYVDLWSENLKGNDWYIIGQVLPQDGGVPLLCESVSVTTQQNTTIEADGETDEFHLNNVPSGIHTIQVRLADRVLLIPEVNIGA